MRQLLAALICAGVLCACNLDRKAFESNVEAGVSSKDKQDNGGADLVPPAKIARTRPSSAIEPPAADGGMMDPTDASAVEPTDTGPATAAEPADAGPGDSGPETNPTGVAAGGGDASLGPDPDDDAGSPEPEPDPEPEGCTTHDCYCETYCKRGVALLCAEEPPLTACIALCQQPIRAGCEAQELAAIRCKAELTADKYICDEDLLAFFALGCQVEDTAARSCRTR